MIKDTGAPMSWSRWLRGVAWCGVGALLLAIPMLGMARVIAMVAPLLLAVAMAGTVSALTDGRTHPEPQRTEEVSGPTTFNRVRGGV